MAGGTLTRKQIIATIEAYDAEIQALQDSKRDTYDEQRAALTAADGKEVARAEIDGLKKAVQRRRQVARHGVDAVEQQDALVEEILAEVANAPRATRESAKTVPVSSEARVRADRSAWPDRQHEPATAPTPQSNVAAAVEAQPLDTAEELQPGSSAPHYKPGNGRVGAMPASAGAPGGQESGTLDSLPANANFAAVPFKGTIQ